MALAAGTRIGPYEVTAQVGVGGMGEVYRATDTNLKRQVAIKVLPASVAGDTERLARFQREAEVLAALNHPNIAQIHGLEKSGGTIALVMELVDGSTLADRITQGAIPVDEALPIAKQVAEALEAAHEQGIIHRDLKPANIKVRADGTVKVLDFGLAKAMEPAAGSSVSNSMSPTITTPAMTQAGMLLGTAAYMSPEQARGKPVDKRADIWAFGAVLFEMLTGKRAFRGEDIADTLALVVRGEPMWEALPPVPARVQQVLRSCLQKEVRQRLGDMQSVRLALEGVFETATAGVSASRGRLVLMAALAVVSALAIALAVATVRHLRETPPPETRVEIVTPANADPMSFALSPDGRQIVFVASGDGASRLWLRPLASTTAQPLAGTEGAVYPFWSPDSRSVGYFAGGRLNRLDIGGGAPQAVATATAARGGTWNAQGVILFAPNLGPLLRVAASGGPTVAATTLEGQSTHRFPVFLPDGRHFLFFVPGAPDTAGIYLGALDSDAMTRLTPAETRGVYVPASAEARSAIEGGWLAWVRDGALVAQRLDLGQRALAGDPVTLADRVAADPGVSVSAVSAAATGLLAYRPGGATRRQLFWLDRSGKALGAWGGPDEDDLRNPNLSPDGRRVAVYRTVQANTDIWLLDGARTSRFTFDAAQDRYPIWSADGSRIVFDSNRKGPRDLYRKPSSGAGSEELLVESPQIKVASDWSADGRFLLYHSVDRQTGADLWVLPTEGDRKPRVFLKTGFNEVWGRFSPDGRWVAYASNESGRYEIYIRSFAAAASGAGASPAAGQWQVSTAGGIYSRWRSDGRELYYIGPSGEMMAAPLVTTATTIEPGAPVALFPARLLGGGVDNAQGPQYDVSRDGRFLVNTVLDDAASPITLIQNWTPGN